MISIVYPEPGFRIKKENERDYIFDNFRKRWLLLTSEEWVRQNFIQYLVKIKNYPTTLIALEKRIQLGELNKRFDILIYDSLHKPWMMIECKGMDVSLNEGVLMQLLRYNISIPVQYMIITNGQHTYGWQNLDGDFRLINEIPSPQ